MNKVNLNYGEYIKDEYEFDLLGKIKSFEKLEFKMPNNYKRFFGKKGYCPFCQAEIEITYSNKKFTTQGVELSKSLKIWECDCGFWEAFSRFSESNDYIDKEDSKHWEKLYYSKVLSIEDSKKEFAVKQLLHEISNNPAVLYEVNPTKFEYLAQYVFSAYFDCEVEHVGKSSDGGVDLLIINSDKPILVQVKRREKNSTVESVATIRDFLGAMYVQNNYKGIIVSTAKSFSNQSKKVIENLKHENRLDYFELFDFNRFCSMLNVLDFSRKKNWEFLIKDW